MLSEIDTRLDTAHRAINALIAGYAALIIASLSDSRRVLKLSRTLGQSLRRNLRLIAPIQRQYLAAKLAADPALRARVLLDLGGLPAMKAWAARRHGARVRQAFLAANGPAAPKIIQPMKRNPAKPYVPKTDRSGCYQLAAIPTGPRGTNHIISGPKPAAAPRRTVRIIRFKPVAVTPDQLIQTSMSIDFAWGRDAPSAPLPSGMAPAMMRPPIIN